MVRLVTETEADSLAAREQRLAEVLSLPEFGDWFTRMTGCVSTLGRVLKHEEHERAKDAKVMAMIDFRAFLVSSFRGSIVWPVLTISPPN